MSENPSDKAAEQATAESVNQEAEQQAQPEVDNVNADKPEATADDVSIEALQEQLAAAQQKADENWDVALRTKAEMENVKRRADNDVDKARKFALEKMANELLAVRDSMEMGLNAAQEEGTDLNKIIEGSELTLKMFSDVMAKFNIVQLDPKGEKFNPDHHQAIAMQPAEGQENNTVMDVMQKGYLLNDRLLRPAMVVVVKN